ncbi:MAG TPA: helix-turn-helix domain-containing protein [Acidimicrobiia bacterium]
MPDYLKPGEAAELLGVSRDTIRRYIDLGLLEGIKTPGGQRRIDRDSVDSIIDRTVTHSPNVKVIK